MPLELLRAIRPALRRALEAMPVVVLTGPRQVGKSTLAQTEVDNPHRRYRTLDDLAEHAAAQQNPDAFVRNDRPLTIDEVQHAPDLLAAIKREVDRQSTAC